MAMTFAPASAAARKAAHPLKLRPITSTSQSAVSAMESSAIGSGAVRQLLAGAEDPAVPAALSDEPLVAGADGAQPNMPAAASPAAPMPAPFKKLRRVHFWVSSIVPSLDWW